MTIASTPLGPVLVGPNGDRLYVLGDSADTVPCTGSCAAPWHDMLWLVLYKVSNDQPLLAGRGTTAVAGPGVTGTVDTFARPDGTRQVTYRGEPLYFFPEGSASPNPGEHPGFAIARP